MRTLASILAILLVACGGKGGTDEDTTTDTTGDTGDSEEDTSPDSTPDTATDTTTDTSDAGDDGTGPDMSDAELDVEDAECVPDCTGRDCGPDPLCGASCGTCIAPDTCEGEGQCEIGWVTIAAGTFTMGSPDVEPGRYPDETQHLVTLTHDYEIQAVEVTQDQFFELMGYRPSHFGSCGGRCPVERVNWYEAAAYANAASVRAGLAPCYECGGSGTSVTCSPSPLDATPYDCPGYRLPTEAEWEYAARAGTTEGTYNGTSTLTGCENPNTVLDPVAWFCGNSGDTSHEVGGKLPNAWGVYDMLGNVFEWSSDSYDTYPGTVSDPWGPASGDQRVIRGGSWFGAASDSRASLRYTFAVYSLGTAVGFRLARSL